MGPSDAHPAGPAAPPREDIPLRFAVNHMGARMHYAVPALLEQAGMLQAFYTDIVGDQGVVGLLDHVIPHKLRSRPMRRLFGRKVPVEVPDHKVRTLPGQALSSFALSRLPPPLRPHFPHGKVESQLRRRILRDGFAGANAFYSVDNGDLPLISEARRRGMFVVYEQVICADVGRIMRQERDLFPGLEPQDSEEIVENGIRRDLEVWSLSDLVIVASQFVAEGLVALGCAPEKIAVVPYGLDMSWLGVEARPYPRRVLFVGTVGLRKGSHYLAEAYRLLKGRGVEAEFRVVGPESVPGITQAPPFRGPSYVGQVPRASVRREFAEGDVFVFPTLAESSALTHLEALAMGLPVITTSHCGSVVEDGVSGFIVPLRDAETLADRIVRVIGDRPLRERMSHEARKRAAQYSWKQYGEGLVAAIVEAYERKKRASVRAI